MEKQEVRGPKELTGKRDWSVFPFREAGPVVDVFEYGVRKYGRPFSYRAGIPTGELLAAIIRHAVHIQDGQELDEESGLPHMAHIAANALMAMSARTQFEAAQLQWVKPLVDCNEIAELIRNKLHGEWP
jgi:hypothetical protein